MILWIADHVYSLLVAKTSENFKWNHSLYSWGCLIICIPSTNVLGHIHISSGMHWSHRLGASTSICLTLPTSDCLPSLSVFIVHKWYVPFCLGCIFYILFWWIFWLFQVWSWIMNKTWAFEQIQFLYGHIFIFMGKYKWVGFLVT